MKYLLMILMVIASTQVTASGVYDVIESLAERAEQATTTSEVEVVELFQAETTEELEAALTDGYPMPWLEEILSDESIPEEDRYWLDCRVRAAIAQDLHLFYDREGNPIHVEADWIGPGEDYWREHVMVYPLIPSDEPEVYINPNNLEDTNIDLSSINEFGEPPVQFSETSPTLMSDPPGDILNLYGEKVGELAAVNRDVVLSRDASVAAVQSGGNERPANWHLTPYACIMYPDGSYIEYPFEQTGTYRSAISSDGSTILFICTHMAYLQTEDQVVDAYIFDKEGNLLRRVTPPERFYGTYFPSISCDGRFACYSLNTWRMLIINCDEGSVYQVVHPVSRGDIRGRLINSDAMRFSPDGQYLATGGHSAGAVFRLEPFEMVWAADGPNETNDVYSVSCSRDVEVVSSSIRKGFGREHYFEVSLYKDNIFIQEQHLSIDRETSEILGGVVSPNGYFHFIRPEIPSWISYTNLPLAVQQLREGD